MLQELASMARYHATTPSLLYCCVRREELGFAMNGLLPNIEELSAEGSECQSEMIDMTPARNAHVDG
jgi:hypothetical protein